MTGAAIVTNETAMAVGHQLAAAIMQVANSGAAPPANWIEVIANATVAAMLSVSQPPTTMAPAQPTPTPMNEGTTTFMFLSTSLVQFMTPGLALFYAGMSGSTSAVAIMLQNFVALGLVFILWVVFVFSLTFGEPWITFHDYHLLGNPTTYFMWNNVGLYGPLQRASDVVVCCFPGMLFAAYQGMFAVITPALISGGLVDRIRFGPYLIFLTLWLVVVYAPLGYWNWGGGWMFQVGAWDFAGGMVVHESAGFSALGALLVLGRRDYPPGTSTPKPHSMPMIVLGTAILWFGWFGFNGGSALTIGGLATIAFVNTQIAPASAMMTWICMDWLIGGKPTINGACAGVVAGLVVITPSAGFVQPVMAIVAGVLGTIWCFTAVEIIKHKTNLDDACDTFGVHGMAGFLGTIFVGVLADGPECADHHTAATWCANPGTVTRSWAQFKIQFGCAVAAAGYSFVVTYLLMKCMFMYFPLLQTSYEQETARDILGHGEACYLTTPPIHATIEDLEAEGTGHTALTEVDSDTESSLKLSPGRGQSNGRGNTGVRGVAVSPRKR